MIEIYFHNLNDDFKTKLNEYKIINNSLSSKNTLFNYPKFLRYLNTYKFTSSVEKWFEAKIPKINFCDPKQDFESLVHISLFKNFIENEVNLHTLEIGIHINYHNIFLNNTLELILQNQNFIHNVRNLKLNIRNYNDKSIFHKRILQIIHLHQNLKKILISYDCTSLTPLYHSLLLSKDYNCSNTLSTIIFYHIRFNLVIDLDKVFEQLNVLESVHIVHCSFLNSSFIQQINNLTKPFKLKSLFTKETSQIEQLQQLLQKSGDYLENFGFEHDISLIQQLQLLKFGKNINFLHFVGYETRITYRIINIIKNIKHSLNYLSIDVCKVVGSSAILQNLGQILPSKLDYINLGFTIEQSDFKVYLENSQDIFINKLLIYQKGTDNILHYIKEYIMKGKRANYLAIKNIHF